MEALRGLPVFRRICGFVRRSDIPSEATFSRAFKEFAKIGLGEKVHQALVAQWVTPELVGHICRDATAIEGREKPRAKPEPPKPETRVERQGRQSAPEALAELPVHCDVGTKKNSKDYKATWIGFKLHADVTDCGLPISLALTAASLHDRQAAIPLMQLTSARLDYLYDVMDAAYDAQPVYAVSRSLGHVPIIDRNGRGREVIPLAPHEAARYKERRVAERFNSRLKEEFGGGNVMVMGSPESRAAPDVWRDRPVRRPVAQAD